MPCSIRCEACHSGLGTHAAPDLFYPVGAPSDRRRSHPLAVAAWAGEGNRCGLQMNLHAACIALSVGRLMTFAPAYLRALLHSPIGSLLGLPCFSSFACVCVCVRFWFDCCVPCLGGLCGGYVPMSGLTLLTALLTPFTRYGFPSGTDLGLGHLVAISCSTRPSTASFQCMPRHVEIPRLPRRLRPTARARTWALSPPLQWSMMTPCGWLVPFQSPHVVPSQTPL